MSARALGWSLAQQAVRQLATFGVFAALSVLLPPAAFGLAAFAQLFFALTTVVAEAGFGTALVQRADVTEAHRSSAFVLNVVLGTLLAMLAVAAAPTIAHGFAEPDAAPVLRALAAGFVLNAFGMTQASLAQRELRFRDLALRDAAAQVAGGAVAIGLALRGAGVWALVAQSLVASAVGTVLLWWISPWRPSLGAWSPVAARALWGYGSRIVGFNLLKFVVQSVDRLVLAYRVPAEALGVYSYGAKLVLQTTGVATGGLGGYLFPRFAQLQADPGAAARLLLRMQGVLVLVLGPSLTLVALATPLVVSSVLAPAWGAVVPVIQFFAGTALLNALFAPAGELLKAFGRPGWLVPWSLALAAAQTAGVVVGSRNGATGTAAAMLVAAMACAPLLYVMVRRLVPVRLPALLRALWPGAGASAMAAAPTVALGLWLPAHGPGPRLVAVGLGALLTAGFTVRQLRRDDMTRTLLGRRGPLTPDAAA